MKSSKADSDSKKSSKSAKAVESVESPPKSRGRASPSRSPARSRKQAEASTGARKSPSRKSPSRKSPSRKSPSRKSPSRKSPSRNAKEIAEPAKSPSRRPAIKSEQKVEATSSKQEPKLSQAQIKLAVINGEALIGSVRDSLRDRKVKSDELPTEPTKVASRRSIRIKAASENFEKLYSLAQNTRLPKSDQSFNTVTDSDDFTQSEDEDDVAAPQRKNRSATRKLLTPNEGLQNIQLSVWQIIGVVFELIIPIVFIAAINVACNKSQCTFISLSLASFKQFKNINVWISSKAALVYFSYLILQLVISILPCCGKKVRLPDSGSIFVANGLFALSFILINLLALEYFNIHIFTIIYQEYYAILTTAILTGVILAVILFIKSRKVPDENRNHYGNSGYLLYDLWIGREVNPVLFKRINLKLLLFRSSISACIILNFVYVYLGLNVKNFPILSTETLLELDTYKQIAGSVSVNSTLLTIASLQVIYYGHALLGESSIISTFEYQYEGTGYMLCVGYAIYAFTVPLVTKAILEQNILLSNYMLALIVAIYFIGFYIYHSSNSQKNLFRANPLDAKLAHLDSIPTFHGNRLLVGGWWGFVRHPNYLGDIILHLSWAIPVISAPPVLFILAAIFLLVTRTKRDGERCHKRYGAAWERYCRRVPYVLVPKVY